MQVPPASVDDPWLVGGSFAGPAARAPVETLVHLDPAVRAAFTPPPRPDRSTAMVRDYVRESPLRTGGAFFGFILAGVLIGYATGPHDPFAAVTMFRSGGGFSFTVGGVFWHNMLVMAIPLVLFPLFFWAPAATSAVTGFSVGHVTAAWLALHLSGGLLAAALLPHGVVEIPALLLGGTLAWRLGVAAWSHGRFGGSWSERAAMAVRAAAPLAALAVVALGVAAFIEVNVTPAVVRTLAGF
jgi:stage II sporulation protein M